MTETPDQMADRLEQQAHAETDPDQRAYGLMVAGCIRKGVVMRATKLDRYRDKVSEIFSANTKAVFSDPNFTAEEKAGTLLLIATQVISHAGFQYGLVTPHLKNAPPEAQIADMMDTLRDVITSQPIIKGGLRVVPTSEKGG